MSLYPSLYLTHEPPTVVAMSLSPSADAMLACFPLARRGQIGTGINSKLSEIRLRSRNCSRAVATDKYTRHVREEELVLLESYFVAYVCVLWSFFFFFFACLVIVRAKMFTEGMWEICNVQNGVK